MARYEGSVIVTGFIAPTDTADTYATHDSALGRGGLREIDTLTARDDISIDRRRVGMIVYVVEDGHYYSLIGDVTNLSWRDLGTSLGGSDELLERVSGVEDGVTNLDERIAVLESRRPTYEMAISLTSVFESKEIAFVHIMAHSVDLPLPDACMATALKPADAILIIKVDDEQIGTIEFVRNFQTGTVNFIEGAAINTNSVLTIEAPQIITELADVGVYLSFTIREPE